MGLHTSRHTRKNSSFSTQAEHLVLLELEALTQPPTFVTRHAIGTSPHLPRLEPCLRLSPHTAQHFQISLSFCSVVFGAEYLKVFQAVCILWSFEPCIGFDVVNLYFPWVESFLAPCTDGAVPEEYLFPQVSLSWPAFASVDVVIAEKAFSLHAFLFFFDLILLGVGVVPGPRYIPLGFILGWHDQFYCSGSEGVFLAESLHDCWHVALVFAP